MQSMPKLDQNVHLWSENTKLKKSHVCCYLFAPKLIKNLFTVKFTSLREDITMCSEKYWVLLEAQSAWLYKLL